MDEYRPYPSSQPIDDGDDSSTSGADGGASTSGASGTAGAYGAASTTGGQGATDTLLSQRASGLRGAAADLDADDDDEDDDEVDGEDGEDGEDTVQASGRRRRGERAERPEPNLDHPGGHLTGTVARLNRPRRFGFLRTEDGMEVFFHASALETGPNSFDSLRTGTPVEFDCHQDEAGRGLAATLVTVTGPAPEPAQPREPREPREGREQREPRESRQQRQRAERGERGERQDRRGQRDHWRVVVLHERPDQSTSEQLEQLLNERGVKPGHVTLALLDRAGGAECWVAFHTGDEGHGHGQGRR
jgi:cold shock CspA family protein